MAKKLKMNPISEKLRQLIATKRTNLEKICVASDLRYNTLNNIFKIQRKFKVSQKIYLALKDAGIINKKEVEAYKEWEIKNL